MSQQPFKVINNNQKQMPSNIEAEQAVIGSILVSNDIYDEISSLIDSGKFFDPIHSKIYDHITEFNILPFVSGCLMCEWLAYAWLGAAAYTPPPNTSACTSTLTINNLDKVSAIKYNATIVEGVGGGAYD